MNVPVDSRSIDIPTEFQSCLTSSVRLIWRRRSHLMLSALLT